MALMSIVLTPHGWQWWLDAQSVHGHEQDGVVYYSFAGQNWTVDDPHSQRTGPRNVYVIAADPAHAALTNTSTVALDWTVTCGPALVGCGLLAIGFTRRSRLRGRQKANELNYNDAYGQGIPSELVRGIIAARDTDSVRPRPTGGTGGNGGGGDSTWSSG